MGFWMHQVSPALAQTKATSSQSRDPIHPGILKFVILSIQASIVWGLGFKVLGLGCRF